MLCPSMPAETGASGLISPAARHQRCHIVIPQGVGAVYRSLLSGAMVFCVARLPSPSHISRSHCGTDETLVPGGAVERQAGPPASIASVASLLDVRGLGIDFLTPQGLVTAVRDIDLHLAAGEVLGLVGESGSGKSVTAL